MVTDFGCELNIMLYVLLSCLLFMCVLTLLTCQQLVGMRLSVWMSDGLRKLPVKKMEQRETCPVTLRSCTVGIYEVEGLLWGLSLIGVRWVLDLTGFVCQLKWTLLTCSIDLSTLF